MMDPRISSSAAGTSDPKVKRAASPAPSCESMKSNWSIMQPPVFSSDTVTSDPMTEAQRAASPVSSCVSMMSDCSIEIPSLLSSGPVTNDTKEQRAASPAPSCESMKSNWSIIQPPVFSSDTVTFDPMEQRSASPVSSCVGVKRNNSMMEPHYSSSGGGTSDQKVKRAASPAPSCESMKSNWSIMQPPVFSSDTVTSDPMTEAQRAESPVSGCVSMRSDAFMSPPAFNSRRGTPDPNVQKERVNRVSEDILESIFKELENKIISLMKKELKRFKNLLSPDYPECTERQVEDEEHKSSVGEGAMKITLHVLRDMNQTDLANTLQTKLAPSCHRKLKSKLQDKFQNICEGISQHGTSALLNEIYTELYITEGGSGDVNNEHEVRQIETASRRPATQETPIKCSDIFRPLPGQDKVIRTVLTKGVAGIGKTVSVQKFILDWSERNVNQDVLFIFPLPFRELNLMKEKQLSLVQLLHCFFPETHELKPTHYTYYKILFIFDGLDECRLPLDFQNNENLWDVTESTSVDVLLTNLIKGNLLPFALLWITSRPAADSQIPPEYIDQVTEVRGFSGPQKEEYFRKRISDQILANRIISHVKSSRSLYIMCHIPVFCWIAATVLERMLGEAESGEIPKTLTQMYTHFLIFHIKHKDQKYDQKSDIDPHQTRKHVLALGKLAFQQLEKGNLIFYEEDLSNSDIDGDLSVYSGMCTQIFREEVVLHLGKVFSFVHLSVQEFLAALYTFITFISSNINVLQQQHPGLVINKLSVFLNSAVDKALQSQTGHLDLFLRFLLGLSLESNQTLLQGLLTQTGSSSDSKEETVEYINEKIRENLTPEKSINLFHCLNELNDHSLVQEVQTYLRRRGGTRLRGSSLSPAQWSALAFVLLNSEEELDEFDLRKYDPSEECLLRLLPVVKASRKAILSGCGLTEVSCKCLASILKTENSLVRELESNNNYVQDSGVEQLCTGLKSSYCKLEILRLSGCGLTEESCKSLASLLQTDKCMLRQLELNGNDLKDSGVEKLCVGLRSSHCNLEILGLSGCLVTEEGCSLLASALSSNPSHLKELDLTYNHPGDSGVKLLSARLEDPHYRLDTLKVEHAGSIRIKPGLRKYACELTLDPNTTYTLLSLSEENRKCTYVWRPQSYPDHPERFYGWEQVMCGESLTGRCYWEAEWRGMAYIAVTYKAIEREGDGAHCVFGYNENSWSLDCYDNIYTVWHKRKRTAITTPPSSSNRVGVYLDWPAGTLSFYSVSSHTHTLTHLHTFHSTFTQPLYAGFMVFPDSSVCVCDLE